MEIQVAQEKIRWRWIAIVLVLAAFLAATLIVSVAQITPPANSPVHAKPESVTVPNSVAHDADVGSFAFGYVEFDQNPKAPGGVPGFDSWPPGSPPPSR